MKTKILIGAGILLTVFIFFLLALGGSSGSDNIVTEEELKTIISSVQCEVKNEEPITYDVALLTNDISFDNEIENQQYTKITLNKAQNFKSLGVAFIVKSNEDLTLKISLNKNDEVLESTTLNLKSGALGNAKLVLDSAVEISQTDNFTITFEQDSEIDFAFDTMLFFFDKE